MSLRLYCGLTAIAGITTTLGVVYCYTAARYPWALLSGRVGHATLLIEAVFLIQYVWSIVRWVTYRPVEPVEDDNVLPSITILIPAYNESHFVRHALQAILSSDYPKDKMSVTVVDDGSTDDTWCHIMAMAPIFKNAQLQYEPIRHDTNLGKRYAICTGLREARGEVVVSLDSDSVLEPRSLRNIASPFVHDPKVGGVAGHLTALNVEGAVLPRLLDILFDSSGNFPRSAQSQTGGFVTILPGALSAYRLCAVYPLIEQLCDSRFLGRPLKHGEDVELTLGLLQAGWSTVYQSNAVIQTVAPEKCTVAFLMYTRWERSSYVYMLKGFSQMAITRVLHSIRGQVFSGIRGIGTQTCKAAPQTSDRHIQTWIIEPADAKESLAYLIGGLYMLLNLFCTAVGNPILFAMSIYQIRLALFHPELLTITIPVMVVLPVFQAALFFADSYPEPEVPACSTFEKSKDISGQAPATKTVSSHTASCTAVASTAERGRLYDRRSRLAWRIQYGGLAGVFHAVVISFSSVYALTTLRSQKWLTR